MLWELGSFSSRQRNASYENQITDYQALLFSLESWCPVIWLLTTIRASEALKWSVGRCVGVRPGVRAPTLSSADWAEVKVLHLTFHGVIVILQLQGSAREVRHSYITVEENLNLN